VNEKQRAARKNPEMILAFTLQPLFVLFLCFGYRFEIQPTNAVPQKFRSLFWIPIPDQLDQLDQLLVRGFVADGCEIRVPDNFVVIRGL
jgi:hypothetical protein